jgi:hypothetical protein
MASTSASIYALVSDVLVGIISGSALDHAAQQESCTADASFARHDFSLATAAQEAALKALAPLAPMCPCPPPPPQTTWQTSQTPESEKVPWAATPKPQTARAEPGAHRYFLTMHLRRTSLHLSVPTSDNI